MRESTIFKLLHDENYDENYFRLFICCSQFANLVYDDKQRKQIP
jgi:hypothetical protein